MPAIGTAIGAIGTFIGSLGAIGTAVVNLGISFGLSYIAKALAPKPKTGGAGGFNGKLQAGGAIPRSFIFGRYATAGSLAYVNTWGEPDKTPNAYLVQVIALSDLPVKGLVGLIVDGAAVTFDPEASQAGKGYAVPEYNKDGKDNLWIRFHDGTQNAADSYLTGKFSADTARPYTSGRVGAGIAYAVITAKVNDKLFTGFPAFKFVLDGVPLYDIRNDDTAGGDGDERWDHPETWSAASGNPAIVIYNLLRGISYAGKKVYGLQTVGGAQLPLSAWAAAANECDVIVTNADASTAKQYVAGGEIQFSAEPGSEIEALLTACNGRLAEVGGIYKLHVGAAGSAVFSFADGDIISTDKQTFTAFPSLDEVVNGVTGTFISPEDGWVEKDLPPRYDADYEAEDGGRRLLANVPYTRVTSNQQGQRLMLSALQEERKARKHGIPMPPWALALEPLDFGSFTSGRNGYAGKLFRADRIDISQNLGIALYITETDPADYDYDPDEDELPISQGSIAIVRPPVQAIRDWAVAGIAIPADAGRAIAGLRLTWGFDADEDLDIDEVQFEVRLASDNSIVLRGSTPFVSAGALDISQNIRGLTAYEIRGTFYSVSGRPFSWSSWLAATTPDVRVDESELSASVRALLQQLDVTRGAALATVLAALQAQVDQLQQSTSGMVALLNDRIEGSIINYIGQRYGDAVSEITDVRTIAEGLADLFINVFVGNTVESGNALFRMTVVDPPDGVATRIQLEARANTAEDFAATGVMFDAGVTALGGKPQITFYAQVEDGDPVPVMLISNGTVKIVGAKLTVTDSAFAPAAAFDGSFIEDLTVNTISITQGAVLAAQAATPSNPSYSSLTTTGGAYDSNYVTIASFTVDVNEFTEFVRTDMILSEVLINWSGSGSVLYQIRLRLLRDGTDVVWPPSGTPYSITSSTRATDLAQVNPFAWIDFPDDEGSHTYEWQIRINCSGAITSGTGSWSAGPVQAAVQVPKNQI
jgi:hypothetical protein